MTGASLLDSTRPTDPSAFEYDPASLDYAPTTLRPTLPWLGGTLAVTQNGKYAVAALPASGTLAFVELASLQPAFSVQAPRGSVPTRIAEDSQGRLHVVLRGTGQLGTLDPSAASPTVVVHDVCVEPRGVTVDSETDEVVVACKSGELVWFDAATLGDPRSVALRRKYLATDLRDIVATAEGLFVSVFRSAEVLKVSRNGALQQRLRPNLVTDRSAAGEFEPHVAHRVALRRDGSLVLQHQRSSVDPLGGSYAPRSRCGAASHNTLSVLSSGETQFQSVGRLPEGPMMDLAITADGAKYAVVSVDGTGNTSLTQGAIAIGAIDPCAEPHSTRSTVEGIVTAVTFDTQGRLLTLSPFDGVLRVDEMAVNIAPAAPPPAGSRSFYQPTRLGISCAQCHPEGDEDGATWLFSDLEGPRRTQALAGRIVATAPLHWRGDRATLFEVLQDTLVGRMQGKMLEETAVRELAQFLDALPKPRPLRAAIGPEVTRGQQVFDVLKCSVCHQGAHLTDNLAHDVGTGDALQTPSLRGVAYRTPLMHNGCAATLRDRFSDCGGDARHGNWSTLEEGDLLALVAYLETL